MTLFSISKQKLSDATLVEYMLCHRLNEAIEVMYEAWFDETVKFIEKQGGSWDDGADIFQESMLTMIEKIRHGTFREQSTLKTYFIGIAKNKWATEVRTQTRRARREAHFQNTDTQDEAYENWVTEKSVQLERVFDQLGDVCKRILIGFYFEKKSMQLLLGETEFKNEQVLRNKKANCMKQLKSLLSESLKPGGNTVAA